MDDENFFHDDDDFEEDDCCPDCGDDLCYGECMEYDDDYY